ncbi:MAG: SLBB domain-containing protein [Pseudomonadota bacterium]
MSNRRDIRTGLRLGIAAVAFILRGSCCAALLAVLAMPAAAQAPDAGRGGLRPAAAPGVLATQSLPASSVSNSRIGNGDVIRITVFGQPDLSAEVGVNDKGQLPMAMVGNVAVAGLTTSEAAAKIADALRTGGYLLKPEVSLDIVQLRSQLVSVLGEVRLPGRYPIPGRLTVLELLATAGGTTDFAEPTVTLLRKSADATAKSDATERAVAAVTAGTPAVPAVPEPTGTPEVAGERIPIRLGDTDNGARTPLDVQLQPGDVVYVNRKKLFYIHGEVNRPGAYPMEPGMTVMRAIALGGGMTQRGSLRRVDINRNAADGKPEAIRSSITAPVLPGDTVYVNESLF